MDLLESLIYGLVSGISEFMPVSSYGHQVLLRKLFGVAQWNPFLDLMVHIGLLLAVIVSCRTSLLGYAREMNGSGRRRRSRRAPSDTRRTYDLRFLLTASVPMLAILLLNSVGRKLENNPLIVCLLFVINGTVLYVVDHLRQSNKDSSQMSALDAILTGLLSGFSVFPGISRVGMCLSAAVGRGADKSHALNWALMLCVPALILMCLFDFVGLFTAAGFSVTFVAVIGYLLAAASAFISGYFIIMFMRFLTVNTGFSGFACYCWGMAILTFILYLIA